jgi:hypothetical protein
VMLDTRAMRSKVEHHKPLLFCTSFLLMNQVPSPY